MEARVLLLVAAVAGAAAPRASANIALAGPYAVDVLEYAVCDDGEYPGVSANFSQVVDEETKETVYRGEFTVNYDLFADDSEVQITAYRWGSTGGWSRIFYHNFTEPYDYIKSNLPNIFELFWKKIGITEKPVTPGTYHFSGLSLRGLTLQKFSSLYYGKYKIYSKALRDGEELFCLQTLVSIYEV
ncbi:uncharacterized protein LOC124596163 [Schistocerca americana]|uniref:uncharacterized protein LOC124596163 n=1 Tax=Schistocerca americana TaxID=7009 RepID=UPI001F4F7514|nr:uncharacterized protein LOC124596163 [Schistocerca americana]XP_049947145.1 uncharacterized protein LOC126455439 isoform X1 [Schistocerca serialis cubense]XP_049947146.1 uncharacterized protein LOC126455439 isoform X1 [Schistocerca serialis cubense]